MNVEGGAALAISVSTDAPVAGPALPVHVYNTSTLGGRKIDGGPAQRVYFVTDAQLASGTFRLEGRIDALPVYVTSDSRRITGNKPIPVYAVNGTSPSGGGSGGSGTGTYYVIQFSEVSNSYVTCGSDASLDDLHATPGGLTVDCWIKAQNLDSIPQICGKFSDAGPLDTGWEFYLSSTAVTVMCYHDGASAWSRTAQFISEDTWHHVLFSYAADRKCYIAIDGVWCTYTMQQASSGNPLSDDTYNFIIGSQLGNDYFLSGEISWLRISNTVRYAVGVNFPAPSKCAPPAVDGLTTELWKMDAGGGIIAASSVVIPANMGFLVNCTWLECT